MQQRIFLYVSVLVLGLELIALFHVQYAQNVKDFTSIFSVHRTQSSTSEIFSPDPAPAPFNPPQQPVENEPRSSGALDVPYINEAPENVWTGPWKNACEEAVITMVEKYYQGVTTVSVSEAKEIMQTLFEEQNERWGTNANSDGARMVTLIETHASFHATLKEDPTLDEIKAEIAAGRPVISLHRGFDLHNKNIPFLPTGSSYHTLVITGYDNESDEFITNDPGDTVDGVERRYFYEVLMNSLHDYNYATQKADGPARVIFTRPLGY